MRKRRNATTVRAVSESERLRRERDEALLRETANAEILHLISMSPGDLELVFRTILENATRICNANFGTLLRFDGQRFHPAAQFNTPTAFWEELARRGPFEARPSRTLAHLMETMQVDHVADVAVTDPQSLITRLGGARTLLNVPMIREKELIGIIGIYRQEVRSFTDKQIALVQNFAEQAVIAIENTRLLSELRQSLERQTATADILRVIAGTPEDSKRALDTIAETAARMFNAASVHFRRIEGDVLRMVGAAGPFAARVRDTLPDQTLDEPTDSAVRCYLDNRQIVIEDRRIGLPSAVGQIARALHEVPVGSQVFTPLSRQAEAIGVMIVTRSEVRPFRQNELDLMKGFADQAVIAIDNARLLNELRESLEQQTATANVLGVISSSSGELKPVFNAMLENAVRLCEAEFGHLFLYDGEAFHTAALHSASRVFAEVRRRPVVLRELHPDNPLSVITRTKAVVHTADVRTEKSYIERDPSFFEFVDTSGARAILLVPMLKENELIGAFTIYRLEVRPFTDKQIDLVKNFAAQAVIAIENARLLDELRQRTTDLTESLEQQTATSDVLRVISSSPGELEPVFDAMLANATRICEASFGNLFLREGPIFRAVAVHNKKSYNDYLRRNSLIDLRANPGVPLDRVARTKQVVHIPDLRTDQSYLGRNAYFVPLVEIVGARTFVSVPMLKHGELIGAINMYRQEVRPFTEKQIELVKNFAAQAVIAIENARLLNELRQRTDDLTESLEQQTATSEVLKVISSSPGDLQPVFNAMLENAVHICDAKFGNLLLYDGDLFQIGATHGAPPAYADLRRREPVIHFGPGDILSRMIATKQPQHVTDFRLEQAYIEREPGSVGLVEKAGARTVLSVPMLKENELIGLVGIYRQEVRPFTDKQTELLQNFAAQAVIAIENTRLL